MPDHWGLAAKLGMTLLWVKWHICKHSENQKGFSPCAEIPFVSRVLGSSLATMWPWRIAQSQAPHVAGKGWISVVLLDPDDFFKFLFFNAYLTH